MFYQHIHWVGGILILQAYFKPRQQRFEDQPFWQQMELINLQKLMQFTLIPKKTFLSMWG